MLKPLSLLSFICLICVSTTAQINQNRKKSPATRVTKPPKIDAKVNDDAWKNAPILDNFIEFRPTNGNKLPKGYETEVKVVYDDAAIYISAVMHDPKPNTILREFSNRDNFGQADFFVVMMMAKTLLSLLYNLPEIN